MRAGTPVMNKMATSPPAPGQSSSAEHPPSLERRRVAAAVEFGDALQDLVAYARLRREGSDTTPPASGPRFPPDLLVRRDPEDLLRSTCRKLLRLEPVVLEQGGPDWMVTTQGGPGKDGPTTTNGHSASGKSSGSGGPPTSNGSTAAQASLVKERSSDATVHPTHAKPSAEKPQGGGSQAKPQIPVVGRPLPNRPHEPVSALPSRRLKIKERVDALLEAAARGPARDHRSRLFDLSDLDDAICEWDEDVVELIVDSPTVLSGYRIGKALSMTQWKIRVAKQWSRVEADLSVDPWNEAFRKERVEEIQRHVSALSTVLDPRAVAAVTTGLGYWRNALLSLTSNGRFSGERSWWRDALLRLASAGNPLSEGAPSSQAPASPTIDVPSRYGERLLTALEEQVANWLDLLTGRRPPESFPVPGIVTALTKKVAADLWARLFRVLMPAVPFLVITGALIFAGVLLYKAYASGATGHTSSGLLGGPTLKGLLGSVGAALSGVFTFLTIQGRPSLGRGAGVANGAPGQADTQRAYTVGSPRGVGGYGTGRALAGVVAELKEDVLSNLVEQLRLEELNLAVNEPLVRCVLALNDRRDKKGGDPLKDAERFLRLIYGDRSNIDRLRPAFKDLCRNQ